MADLISRTAMLEALGHFNDYVNGDPHFLNGIETAKEITENLPAVDSVPVVRCKDCKFYGEEPYGTLKECYRGCGWTEPVDFCSKGKRRESE